MNLSEAMLLLDKREREDIRKTIDEYDRISELINKETDEKRKRILNLKKRRLQKKASAILARLYIVSKKENS
jgi:hypothetical protein